MARYTLLLEPDAEDGGFTVTVPALPGIVTEGDTFEEALDMARSAIRVHLAGLRKRGEEIPIEDVQPLLTTVEVEIYDLAVLPAD